MEALFLEHEKLSTKGNLSKSLEDVQKTIDLLTRARDAVVASRYRNVVLGFLVQRFPVNHSCDHDAD